MSSHPLVRAGLSAAAFLCIPLAPICAQDPPCPPATSVAFAEALAQAGAALQVAFQPPSSGDYTVEDLREHHAVQLAAAGQAIIDGAYEISSLLPRSSPYHGTARTLLIGCGTHLIEAGNQLLMQEFDQAAAAMSAFATDMENAELFSGELRSFRIDAMANASAALASDFAILGGRRQDFVDAFSWAFATAATDVDGLQEAVAFLASLKDPTMLALFGLDSPDEMAALVAAGAAFDDEPFQDWIAANSENGEGILVAATTLMVSDDLAMLGESLDDVSEELEECPPCGSEDCPNLCTEDDECGECKASDLGLGAGVAADLDPDDIDSLVKIVGVTLAASALADDVMAPMTAAENAAGFANFLKVVKLVCTYYPQFYIKVEYHCCVVKTCKDFWGCLPIWTNVERLECEERESDWVKLDGDTMHWHVLVTGNKRKLQKALKDAIKNKTKEFCETACQ